jgi:uncharacterized membrane protein YfcA
VSVEPIVLPLITLLAATVNGALGYGFSTITVPLALLSLSNRVLNPALVVVEVMLNAYVLFVNRESVSGVWRRVLPIMAGLAPGIVLGTTFITVANPDWMKLYTFACLIPLILLQAAGYRRPIKSERSAGFVFGAGVGVVYAVTTISGPPLATMLNNQGFVKRDFRTALALVRLAESALTATAFLYVGMFTRATVALSLQILPSLALGIPLGALMIRRVRAETFRRVCMSFDVWVVAFGFTSMLRLLAVADAMTAFTMFAAVSTFDLFLLYRFFSREHGAVPARRLAATCWGDLRNWRRTEPSLSGRLADSAEAHRRA